MQEEELEELAGHKDPLVRKFAEHYLDAFFRNPSKRLHIKQLEMVELIIEELGKVKNLKKAQAALSEDSTEEEKEAVSLTLFGNKEIFSQVMDIFKNMGVILASIKAGEAAGEIISATDTPLKGTKVKIRLKDGVPLP